MSRKIGLLGLLCLGIVSLGTGAFAQVALEDKSPGWVIIVAADYQGANGTLYKTVQNDAMRAYQAVVTDARVPANHIVLLAEGKDIDQFVSDGRMTPAPHTAPLSERQPDFDSAMKELAKVNPVSASDLISQAKSNTTDATELRTLGNYEATFLDGDRKVPLYASPTRANFQFARDMVARFATKDQFVTFIVSTHAAPTPLVAALKQQQDGKLDDSGCLTQEDFRIAKCASHTRLLLIDAQDCTPAEAKTLFKDATTPSAGAPNRYSDIQKVLADGIEGGSAVVMTSSDGSRPSGYKILMNESLFLWQLFQDVSKKLSMLNFGAVIDKLNHNFKSGLVKFKLKPAPECALYPDSARSLETRVAFNLSQSKEDSDLVPISAAEIAMEPIPSIGRVARGAIVVQRDQAPIFEVTADSQGALKQRGQTVAAGLKALVTHPGLTSSDLKQIGVGQVGQYVVVTLPKKVIRPDGKNYLVTADDQMASYMNCDTKQLASNIAHQVRLLMDRQYRSTAAVDPPTDEDLYNTGLLFLSKQNYTQAEKSFTAAIDLSPGYVEAYLHLAETYLLDKKKSDAGTVLGNLKELIQQKAVDTSAVQMKRLAELKAVTR